ncbi:MAG: hypothetical protein LH465_06170 [Sphingomonas bacterium]|nr:hypothetical protein [Sphingomonas bacterium]
MVSLNEQHTGELKRLSTALRCLLMTGFADAETLASLPAQIEVIPKPIDYHRLAQAFV